MNLVLIGYRGTGKSAVARILAARLKWPTCNLDEAIIEKAGLTIPQIVEQHGWDFFRDLESQVVDEAGNLDRTIIDAGGGVVVHSRNVEALRKNSFVVWLKADPKTIMRRIKDDFNRPSLTGKKSFLEEVGEVLSERIPLYQAAAHLEIETSTLSPEEVVEKILDQVKEKLVTLNNETQQ